MRLVERAAGSHRRLRQFRSAQEERAARFCAICTLEDGHGHTGQSDGERDGQLPRVRDIQQPAATIVPTGNGNGSLCAVFMARHWGGMVGKLVVAEK